MSGPVKLTYEQRRTRVRAAARENGICYSCIKAPSVKPGGRCQSCMDRDRRNQAARRKTPAGKAKAARDAAARRALRAGRKAAQRCTECGWLDASGSGMCDRCARARAKRHALEHARFNAAVNLLWCTRGPWVHEQDDGTLEVWPTEQEAVAAAVFYDGSCEVRELR